MVANRLGDVLVHTTGFELLARPLRSGRRRPAAHRRLTGLDGPGTDAARVSCGSPPGVQEHGRRDPSSL
ncbi:hypothetical protein AB0L40_11250 [Patulibacter sp. NPDC049589]|uniref:hypothetical protein n=1 Tax=Patulibacter sp. NPDC049589 TaxID=3154731 RepID=UPI00343675A4